MPVDSRVWTVRDGPARGAKVPTGINVGIGAGVVVLAASAAAAVPVSAVTVRLTVMAAALAGFAVLTVDPLAVGATYVLGFAVFDGFLVDRLGELSWHGPADVGRLLALAACALTGLIGGVAYPHGARRRHVMPDVVFVLLTVVLFAVLALAVRAVEKL